MALEGLHHITAITGDAPANVAFHRDVLGLRMVKKTVNFDAPDVYHLYFGSETGEPGSLLTFFEFPGARPGRAGAGMVHRILWRVGSGAALDFWAQRIPGATREAGGVRFTDPEGLDHELVVVGAALPDAPLTARGDGIPPEHALQGFAGVRAYATDPARSRPLLDALGFSADGELRGAQRGGFYAYDVAPEEAPLQGAGTVHHVAWSAADDAELEAVRAIAVGAGAHPTHIVDRQYFHSVYFREPSGVLFELASRDIGFDVDEPLDHLGESLVLPPQHEHLRERLERTLTPLPAAPGSA